MSADEPFSSPGHDKHFSLGPDDVYVELKRRIERVDDCLFSGEEAVVHLIGRIVGP